MPPKNPPSESSSSLSLSQTPVFFPVTPPPKPFPFPLVCSFAFPGVFFLAGVKTLTPGTLLVFAGDPKISRRNSGAVRGEESRSESPAGWLLVLRFVRGVR